MTDKLFPVSEIFGITIQGEGILAGRQTSFLRLAGCDFRCSWCDTPDSVIPERIKDNHTKMSAGQIVREIRRVAGNVHHVTISGGNPCIHDLTEVCRLLKHVDAFIGERKFEIAIETQGSVPMPAWMDYVNILTVSPKPPSSGMKTDWNILREYMSYIAIDLHGCIKIVVFDDADYEYAMDVFSMAAECIPCYLMPGTSQQWRDDLIVIGDSKRIITEPGTNNKIREDICDRTRWLAEKVCSDPRASRVRVMPQLHALMYGYRKGV